MKKKKITLICSARENDPTQESRFTPAGITLLAALVPDDFEVKLIDMLTGDRVDYEAPVDLVGITCRTPIATVTYEMADRFRARGAIVVLGGPHPSAVPLDAIQHADAVVVGEAETLWPRLLADYKTGELKKFYVCGPLGFSPGENSLHHDPNFPSLEGLPTPRRDLLPRWRYRMDTLFTTRGCPFNCSFCMVPNLFGKKIRHRPIEDVVQEVATLKRLYYNVDDNVFGVPGDEDYYLELYKELAKHRRGRIWVGQSGPRVVESEKGRETLRWAVKSGLSMLMAGIESVSPQGLSETHALSKVTGSGKPADIEKISEQIRIIQDHGIFVIGWFVLGLDSDNQDSYERTLAFSERAGIAPIIINLFPMPGTQIYDEFINTGRIKSDVTWQDYSDLSGNIIYYHPTMSEQEMIDGTISAMTKGYKLNKILSRSLTFTRRRPSPASFIMATMSQLGFKRSFCNY